MRLTVIENDPNFKNISFQFDCMLCGKSVNTKDDYPTYSDNKPEHSFQGYCAACAKEIMIQHDALQKASIDAASESYDLFATNDHLAGGTQS